MKLIDRLKRAGIAACLGLPVIATFAADRMERDFKAPPKSVKTAVYWYWIEGNITKEGVIKDLEAMKKAGINRAFIANIGGTGTGDPNALHKVEFMSDEWWDITHAALKRASELDIEIGVFNSPGWSQSGGPWIKHNETMRYLASSRKDLKGPATVSVTLPQPKEEFEDVKVLAFPNPTPEGTCLGTANTTITTLPAADNVSKIVDGDIGTGMNFPEGKEMAIDFVPASPFTARSIVVRPMAAPINTDIELQALGADGTYRHRKQLQPQPHPRLEESGIRPICGSRHVVRSGDSHRFPRDIPQYRSACGDCRTHHIVGSQSGTLQREITCEAVPVGSAVMARISLARPARRPRLCAAPVGGA